MPAGYCALPGCGMAFEGAGKNLCALDAEINSAVLNSGNGGLRNAREFGELTLAQFLEFAQDTDGLTDRNFHSFPWQDDNSSYQGLR